MHVFIRRVKQAVLNSRSSLFRLTLCCAAALFFLCAHGYGNEAEYENIKTAIESVLRAYQQEAMLYVETDQRFCTVSDPYFLLSEEASRQTFELSGEELSLSQLQGNISFLEKKADYYAAMRQMQGIYRENLQLRYNCQELTLEDRTAHAFVTEAASFRYLDSDRPSVYQTYYSVDLVKLDGRWLVADVTDGSWFDSLYKSDPAFDVSAALDTFAASLQTDSCVVHNPYTPPPGSAIAYNGANAAAYAYTYSRREADIPRNEFYNAQFQSFAGKGGDCMNFASQCMWAGFGGSQETAGVTGHALPMDTEGSSIWYSWDTGKNTGTTSWVSCQNFRKYLTGSADGLGESGSNGAEDPGMYATIMDVAAGSDLSGVSTQELVGAVAHVSGEGGPYAHAIVLTAATGVSRSQIWFCAHTTDITHVKLGDYYTGSMKIYVPRYLRTGSAPAPSLQVTRLAPVPAGYSQALRCWAGSPQYRMSISVTVPGGTEPSATFAGSVNECFLDYIFSQEGLYRVECSAQAAENAPVERNTFYVRCYLPAEESPSDPGHGADPAPDASSEMPEWLKPRADE